MIKFSNMKHFGGFTTERLCHSMSPVSTGLRAANKTAREQGASVVAAHTGWISVRGISHSEHNEPWLFFCYTMERCVFASAP